MTNVLKIIDINGYNIYFMPLPKEFRFTHSVFINNYVENLPTRIIIMFFLTLVSLGQNHVKKKINVQKKNLQ